VASCVWVNTHVKIILICLYLDDKVEVAALKIRVKDELWRQDARIHTNEPILLALGTVYCPLTSFLVLSNGINNILVRRENELIGAFLVGKVLVHIY
jgi:hypothetical protein